MLPLSTLCTHVSSLPFTAFLRPEELANSRDGFYSSSFPLHQNRLLLKDAVSHCKQGTEFWGDATAVGHPKAFLGAGGLCLSFPVMGGGNLGRQQGKSELHRGLLSDLHSLPSLLF